MADKNKKEVFIKKLIYNDKYLIVFLLLRQLLFGFQLR